MAGEVYAQKNNKTRNLLIGLGAAMAVVLVLLITVIVIMFTRGSQPQSSLDYVDIANQYVEQMDYSNAVRTYWAAIEKSPDIAEYYLELGSVYETMEKEDAACTVYQMGYERTGSMLLFMRWDGVKQKLNASSLGGDKSAGVSGTSFSFNTFLAERLAKYTYKQYSTAYGAPSVHASGSGYSVRYAGVNAVFLYYNTAGNSYVVDSVNHKPRDNRRPIEIQLNDISLLFVGIGSGKTMEDVARLGVEDVSIGKDVGYGKQILSFRRFGALFEIECDDVGSFGPGSWCLIRPIAVGEDPDVATTAEEETEAEAESTTARETTTEPEAPTTYGLRGVVKNAVDGLGIPNVYLTLHCVSYSGQSDYTETTDNEGAFNFPDIAEGDYVLYLSCQGFEEESMNISFGGDEEVLDINVVMSPVLLEGEIRFVLTWNETPHDLDSHLEGRSSSGQGVNIYFGSMIATDSNGTIAELDVDDMHSYGPETITLYDIGGTYEYFVEDFGHEGTMGINGATVKIYVSGQSPITVDVPSGVRDVWRVCTVSNGSVTVVNTAGD